ncbi:hypothetical protein ACVIGB_000673 [Bradyrhizobium sp. USDA 4341]
MSKWNSNLRTREDYERRIRELVQRYENGDNSERQFDEIEVLAFAAYRDPECDTGRGRMRLSQALAMFNNTSPAEFKQVFDVPDIARNFEINYVLVKEVAGRNVGMSIMKDILTETGHIPTVCMRALGRLVSPASRHVKSRPTHELAHAI